MNTAGNYKQIVYGSGVQKFKSKLSALKGWLSHPEMKKSHVLANRSMLIQYIDFLSSIAIHGATLQDYLIFEFYKKGYKERKSYVTGRKLHEFFDKVNNKNKTDIFKNKNMFADYFSEYLGREIFKLNLDGNNIKEAKNWLSTKNVVFAKPSGGVQGRGVTRLIVGEDVEEIVNHCLENKLDIIEEAIIQHPKVNILHPDSVNTVRFITLVDNDDIKYLGASIRMGNGKHVDNGGIYASVDMQTGVIDSIAYTNFGEKYVTHPITNQPIKGFQVPFWKEVIEICKKAAFEVPDINCVGWDVAISENGPLLIEGNDRWSRFLWQLPKQQGLYHTIK